MPLEECCDLSRIGGDGHTQLAGVSDRFVLALVHRLVGADRQRLKRHLGVGPPDLHGLLQQ